MGVGVWIWSSIEALRVRGRGWASDGEPPVEEDGPLN